MSNMTENQRSQYERMDLHGPDRSVRTKGTRALTIYAVIALAVLIALSWAALERLDGWPQFVVLGAIIMTAIGMMIAVDPLRRS